MKAVSFIPQFILGARALQTQRKRESGSIRRRRSSIWPRFHHKNVIFYVSHQSNHRLISNIPVKANDLMPQVPMRAEPDSIKRAHGHQMLPT